MRTLTQVAAVSGLAVFMAAATPGTAFAQTDYSIPDTDVDHMDVDTLIHPKHVDDLVLTWDDEAGLTVSDNEHASDLDADHQVWALNNLGEIPAEVVEADLAGEFGDLEEDGEIFDARELPGFLVAISNVDGSCLVVDRESYRESGDDRDVPGRDRIADVVAEDCDETENNPLWALRFRDRDDGIDILLHTTELFDSGMAAAAPEDPEALIEEELSEMTEPEEQAAGEVLLLGTERRAVEEGATVDVSNPSGWHNQVWRSMVFTVPTEEEPPADEPPVDEPRLPVTGSSSVVGVSAGAALVAVGGAVVWWRRRQHGASDTW